MTFYDIHSWKDIILAPIFFILLLWFAYKISFKFEKDKKIRKFIYHSFWIKNIIATVFICFFWYMYGSLLDLGGYYKSMKIISLILNQNENVSIFDLYLNIDRFNYYTNLELLPFGVDPTNTLPLIVLPFYYLGFGSIFCIIYLINYIVFLASLFFYNVLCVFVKNQKTIAIISIFYLPSVVIWASSIYKDTIAYIGMCFLIYVLFQFFIQKKYFFKYLLIMIATNYLILITKAHILIINVFIALWILQVFAKKMSPELRYAFYAIGLVLFMIGGQFAITSIAQSQLDAAKFTDIEKVTSIVEGFNNYYSDADAQGGSQYSIGTFEPSLQGLMKLMPSGYIVTFFRPYLWEFRSPVFVFNVLESFVLLSMTIYILFKWRLRVFKEIFKNEFLTFCFLYTLVLGAMIGIMSFNFGTLARYKTPVMPFFAFLVFVLFDKVRDEVKQKRKLKKTQLHNSGIATFR